MSRLLDTHTNSVLAGASWCRDGASIEGSESLAQETFYLPATRALWVRVWVLGSSAGSGQIEVTWARDSEPSIEGPSRHHEAPARTEFVCASSNLLNSVPHLRM